MSPLEHRWIPLQNLPDQRRRSNAVITVLKEFGSHHESMTFVPIGKKLR